MLKYEYIATACFLSLCFYRKTFKNYIELLTMKIPWLKWLKSFHSFFAPSVSKMSLELTACTSSIGKNICIIGKNICRYIFSILPMSPNLFYQKLQNILFHAEKIFCFTTKYFYRNKILSCFKSFQNVISMIR